VELGLLEDFLALADTLNFSRAAEARHITQPAFSRRVRALEAWAGAALFARTTHGVTLTAAGRHFRNQAEALVRSFHQLRRDTLEASERDAKLLTFAATHALSFNFFPKWVRSHDQILALGNLNLVSDSMLACEQMMLRGDVQFLLCHYQQGVTTEMDTGQFKSIAVGHDTLLPLCAANSNGKARWPLGGGKTVKHLAYSPQSGLGRIVAAGRKTKALPVKLSTTFTTHLAATLLSMCRAGEGVAWLPRTLAEDDLASGRLVSAGGPEFEQPIEIRLFRPVARQSPAAEAAWVAFRKTATATSSKP